MAEAPTWEPPLDPDFERMYYECEKAWERDRPFVVAFDTETSGLEWADDAFCVTVAWAGPHGTEGHYIELKKFDGRPLTALILGKAETLIGHNIKFDLHRVINLGLFDKEHLYNGTIIEDTEALAHLEDEHRKKGLKILALELLDIQEDTVEVPIKSGPNAGKMRLVPKEVYELDQAKRWAKKEFGYNSVQDISYDVLPRGVVVPYAIKDAVFTFDLYEYLYPRVAQFDDLLGKYEEEMRTTLTFLDMEAAGLGTDQTYVATAVRTYAKKALAHELRIEEIVGKPVRTGKIPAKERALFFNPQSNTDIPAYFTKAGYPREKYDEESLSTIDHPLAQALLDLRGDAKILNTYLRALQRGAVDGIYHPSIRQHGTVTGRTSSGAARGDS